MIFNGKVDIGVYLGPMPVDKYFYTGIIATKIRLYQFMVTQFVLFQNKLSIGSA